MDVQKKLWYDEYVPEDEKIQPIEYDELDESSDSAVADPAEDSDNDTEAERSEKRLRRELKAEALRRMEEAARTYDDFQEVVQAWDKRDDHRGRTIRNHEQNRGDVPLDYGVNDVSNVLVFPMWMGSPTERQIASGNFLDLFANCPYEMHDLTGKDYIRDAVQELKDEYKELLYFMALHGHSPQRMAALYGQTDRNIRKVRDAMLRRMQKSLYNGLLGQAKQGYRPTHRETEFIERYETGLEADHADPV